jgi:hypothetical protein
MVTVCDGVIPIAAFCSVFYGQKGSVQRISIKKCFLFMVGSVSHVKQFTAGSKNSLKDARKSQMMKQRYEIS